MVFNTTTARPSLDCIPAYEDSFSESKIKQESDSVKNAPHNPSILSLCTAQAASASRQRLLNNTLLRALLLGTLQSSLDELVHFLGGNRVKRQLCARQMDFLFDYLACSHRCGYVRVVRSALHESQTHGSCYAAAKTDRINVNVDCLTV